MDKYMLPVDTAANSFHNNNIKSRLFLICEAHPASISLNTTFITSKQSSNSQQPRCAPKHLSFTAATMKIAAGNTPKQALPYSARMETAVSAKKGRLASSSFFPWNVPIAMKRPRTAQAKRHLQRIEESRWEEPQSCEDQTRRTRTEVGDWESCTPNELRRMDTDELGLTYPKAVMRNMELGTDISQCRTWFHGQPLMLSSADRIQGYE